MADVFIAGFFVGLFFAAVSAILAGVFGATAGGASRPSSLLIAVTITAFGGVGYVILRPLALGAPASLAAGLLAAVGAAGMTRVVERRLFARKDGEGAEP